VVPSQKGLSSMKLVKEVLNVNICTIPLFIREDVGPLCYHESEVFLLTPVEQTDGS
jgi:hypothetical protein